MSSYDFHNKALDHTGLTFLEGKRVKAYTLTGQALTGIFHYHGDWAEVTSPTTGKSAYINLANTSGILLLPEKEST